MSVRRCDRCKSPNMPANISLTHGTWTEEICQDCFNKEMARRLDVALRRLPVESISVSDLRGRKRRFALTHRVIHLGNLLEAEEITKRGQPGYRFQIIGAHDVAIEDVLEKLKQKIERNIKKRYITEHHVEGHTLLGVDGDEVAGRFEADPYSGNPLVIVDGTPYDWIEFGQLLKQFEGFQFKLVISDLTDE